MTRTNSEDLALLVLEMVRAVDDDLNIASDSDLAKDCEVARELAIRVLGDHVVQELVTTGVELVGEDCYTCRGYYVGADLTRVNGMPLCQGCRDEYATGA